MGIGPIWEIHSLSVYPLLLYYTSMGRKNVGEQATRYSLKQTTTVFICYCIKMSSTTTVFICYCIKLTIELIVDTYKTKLFTVITVELN